MWSAHFATAQADFTIHKTDELDHLSLPEADARSNGGKVLMWGLQHLMHIGERQAAEITAIYPVSDLDDFCDRVNGRVVNKNVIANLIRLGFFDCLYEDEPPEMRRVLAWRHYHERQGMMTIQAAVQQVHAEYQDIKDRMAPLTLTQRTWLSSRRWRRGLGRRQKNSWKPARRATSDGCIS